jgi:hypothetical protein
LTELTEQDRKILALAARDDVGAGEMTNLIREMGLTEIRYYQRLNALLDTEAALAAFPVAVNRLRRLRGGRVRVLRGVRL